MSEPKETGKRLSYKFRIYPNARQERYFDVNFDAVRFVYNHFLEARIKAYRATLETLEDGSPNPDYVPGARPMSFFDTSKALTALKKETLDENGRAWLRDADSLALVYAIRHLDQAYQNFFRRAKGGGKPGFPKFKSRNDAHRSFTVGSCKVVDEGHVSLPKIGPVKARVTREVEGDVVSATVSRNAAGQYHVSINVKNADIKPLPERDNAIGIAMGVRKWVVTSDGQVFDNPKAGKKMERKLAREQRRLSRKKPGSANYEKQKIKVARVNNKITNIRQYETHNLTRELVNENGIIVSREMAVSKMLKGGGAEKKLPKTAQSKVNKAVLDANFGEINRQLAYKADWAGREFVLVPSNAPTSQICSNCGYRHAPAVEKLTKEWVCPECNAVHDRMQNAALNVLEVGMDMLNGTNESHVLREAKKSRRKHQEDSDSLSG